MVVAAVGVSNQENRVFTHFGSAEDPVITNNAKGKPKENPGDKIADDLYNLAHVADVLLRVQKRVFARSKKITEGFRLVARSCEGGAQGNPLTNLFYPMSTDTALKNVEKLYPGSSSWDDLGNEPSFGGATRDSEDNILVDMGIWALTPL